MNCFICRGRNGWTVKDRQCSTVIRQFLCVAKSTCATCMLTTFVDFSVLVCGIKNWVAFCSAILAMSKPVIIWLMISCGARHVCSCATAYLLTGAQSTLGWDRSRCSRIISSDYNRIILANYFERIYWIHPPDQYIVLLFISGYLANQ